jgi:hypothetical protein
MIMEPTADDVARAYCEFGRTQNAELFWAFETVTLLAFSQQWDALWDVTLRAIAATDDEDVLSFVAAGPLEDLIRYAAPIVEERIVEQIRKDARFRRTLTGAWAREEQKEFWARVLPLLKELSFSNPA